MNGKAAHRSNSETDGGENVCFIDNKVEGFYKETIQGTREMTLMELEEGDGKTDGGQITEEEKGEVIGDSLTSSPSTSFFSASSPLFFTHLSFPRSGWYLIKLSHHRCLQIGKRYRKRETKTEDKDGTADRCSYLWESLCRIYK